MGDAVESPAASPLDPEAAAALIDGELVRTHAALDQRLHEQLAAWGVAWLVGLGLIWWQVRTQTPYTGPAGWPAAIFAVLLVLAMTLTGLRIGRATRGVRGDRSLRGALYGCTWLLGFAALYALIAALALTGATPEVVGLVATCGAMATTGLLFAAGAAVTGVRALMVLGVWLVLLAGIAGFTGPVTATAIEAIGGGGGLLVAALVLAVRRRSSR